MCFLVTVCVSIKIYAKEWQPYKGHTRKKKLKTFSDFLELWENATNFANQQGRSPWRPFNIWNEAIHSCWMKKSSKKGWCDVQKIKTFLQSVGDYDIKNHIDFFFFFLHWHLLRRWENEYTSIRWKWSDSSRVCVMLWDIVTPSREEGRQAGTMCFLDSRCWLLMSIEKNERTGFNKNIQMSRVYTPGNNMLISYTLASLAGYTHRAYWQQWCPSLCRWGLWNGMFLSLETDPVGKGIWNKANSWICVAEPYLRA